MNLKGNTIFITGGGSGIGRALAVELHKLGNQVIISGRRKGHLTNAAEANPGMDFVELDLSNRASINSVATELIEKYPSLNVLINNAGVMQIDSVEGAVADDLIVSTIDTNLVGPIRLTSALIEHLKKQPSASVVIVSSVLGFIPMAAAAVYCSTKAALHSYSQSLRFRLRNSSVRVFEVIPPWVQTELLNSTEDPDAMPLAKFIRGTMHSLASDAEEIMVPRAAVLRGQAGPNEALFVRSFNEDLEKSFARR